jgi:polysaccharide export outer membrane protein
VIWESSPEGLFGYSLWDTVNPEGLPLSAAYASVSELGTTPLEAAANAASTGRPGSQGVSPNSTFGVSSQDFAASLGSASSMLTQPAGTGDVGQAASSSASLTATLGAQLSPSSSGSPGGTPGAQLGLPGGGTAQSGGLPQGADAATLRALQQSGVASGLPQLPPSLQNLGQIGRPGTRIPVQEVGSDGAITVPYGGRIEVAGRTPHEVEQAVERRLAGKAIDPQVLVAVLGSPANSVAVAGEVIGGKRVLLNPAGDRLLDVIAAAGGARAPVHDTFVELSRDGVTATTPLAMLVEHPEENIFARPGDVLTLVQRPQTFSVFGATGKNAAITFDRDRLSLAEALAKSGGLLDDQADPRAVFLFRYEPDSVVKALGQPLAADAPKGISPVAYRFDLNEAKSYLLAKQFPVRDKDIVFVANAQIQPVYHFFTALQNVTGPVVTGFVVCQSGSC